MPHTQPPSLWRAEHTSSIGAPSPAHTIPLLGAAPPVVPGIDLWDLWPLQNADGSTSRFDGHSLWFVLCADARPDPETRHDFVRIRLMSLDPMGLWHDHGHALPDGLTPGSREWAGSALYHPETRKVTLFYTVAGYRDEAQISFAQRLFQTTGELHTGPDGFAITDWSAPAESFASDDHHYVLVNQRDGKPGAIKGFRDPAFFRDPADGAAYLLFTGSLKASAHTHNACIGIARATDASLTQWQILPPLVDADGLNNEQERPVMIHHQGRYYLFWSTQAKVFAPGSPPAPTGLYGMVADQLFGPYVPLNGSGLVAGNPPQAPFQTYSWWVDKDLKVWGFVDYPGVVAHVDDPDWRRQHFGGTPAPAFGLALNGTSATVIHP